MIRLSSFQEDNIGVRPRSQRTQCKAATWYCPRGSNRPFASHPNSMTAKAWSHFSTLANLICDLQPFPLLNAFNLYLEQFKWKNMEKPIVRKILEKNTSLIVSHDHSLALQHQEMHWSTLLEFSSFVPSCITSRHTMWQGKSAVPWRSPPTCLVTIRSQAWMHWCGLLHKIFRPRMVQNKRVRGWWGWSMTQFWIVRNHLYFPYCLFNLHFEDLRFFSTKKTTKTSAFHRTASTHLWQSLPCFDLKIPPSSPWIFVQPLKVMMKIKKLIFGGKQTLKCHNYRTSISFLMCI